MHQSLKKFFLSYAAGNLGAVANFLFGAILVGTGTMAWLGIQFPPPVLPAAIYKQLVWGGIWGWMLMLPVPKSKALFHGFLLGIPPSIVAGTWVFPKMGAGYFGSDLGSVMPPLIFVFNWVWGTVTIWSYRKAS